MLSREQAREVSLRQTVLEQDLAEPPSAAAQRAVDVLERQAQTVHERA